MILIPYHEAKTYIKEADVLLFRGRGLSSWMIQRYGGGIHSHAGMAHWDDDNLQCLEFREFKGGRSTSLKRQVETHPDNIDIFRPAHIIHHNQFSVWPETDIESVKVEYSEKEKIHIFNESMADSVTDVMIKLTGLPYGWKNIWKLVRHYVPFARLAKQNIKDDDPMNVFVCSTAVAYAFRKAYVDPVPYLADSAVMPADLARSALFRYQFTISKDW